MRVLDDIEQADRLVLGGSPADHALPGLGQLPLERLEAVHTVVEQALAVDQVEACAGLGFRQALLDHRGDELLGDPAAGRAGAEDRDGVLARAGAR